MGFWDNILRPAWRFYTPNVRYLHTVQEVVDEVFGEGLSVAGMWKQQPHLRTVVGFLARNVAHVGIHLYRRDGEDRQRVYHPILRKPNPLLSMYDLLFALEADMKLYDRAYWWIRKTDSGPQIYRLPPAWVNPVPENAFLVKEYEVVNDKQDIIKVPFEEIVSFTGYNPEDPLLGSPTVMALRTVLIEQMQAAAYRAQMWKHGNRVSAVLERPLGAKWSPGARDAFREDWYAQWTGDGPRAGGTPILEDGMTLKRIDFSAHESQFVEAAKLAMGTVANAFYVPGSMVGVMDGANFSVVKELRQMLYTETLAPDFEQIAQRLNGWLLPMLGLSTDEYYFEFHIQRKLAGSFEEQAAVLSTAVGAPWMLRDEARSRFNLPQVEGGDQLVTPLNVLIGGQASPRDSGSQNEKALLQLLDARLKEVEATPQGLIRGQGSKELTGGLKAGGRRKLLTGYEAKYAEILQGFFDRQKQVAQSRLKAGRKDWWDEGRWDRELGHDLTAWAVMTSTGVAHTVLEDHGFEHDVYNPDQAEKWLTLTSQHAAQNINRKTKERLDEALADEEPDIERVFSEERSSQLAMAATTLIAAFATQEAGKQSGAATKTWITGSNPRPDHAAMDGETVSMRDNFSNGMAWPGDSAGGVENVAGCNCELEVNWEE